MILRKSTQFSTEAYSVHDDSGHVGYVVLGRYGDFESFDREYNFVRTPKVARDNAEDAARDLITAIRK